MGEGIKPEITEVDHFNDHVGWYFYKQESVVYGPSPFFKSSNVLFHLGHMIIVCCNLKANVNISNIASEELKLTIHKGDSETETSLCVDIVDLHNGIQQCWRFLVGDHFGCIETKVTGGGHKNWELIDKHPMSFLLYPHNNKILYLCHLYVLSKWKKRWEDLPLQVMTTMARMMVIYWKKQSDFP
jgi:hypothetical protein